MDYAGAQNAAAAVDQRKGILVDLERCTKNLMELRKRLNGLSVTVSGPKPDEGKVPQEIKGRHLEAQVGEISLLVQHCHDSLSWIESSFGS